MKDIHTESPSENISTNRAVDNDRNKRTDIHSERPDLVVCFDRDRTVSVSPSPRPGERAVPLAWVKYLAHDEETANVDVWATGNQRLCEEAAIPGTAEAVACWKQLTATDSSEQSTEYTIDGHAGLDRKLPRLRRRDRLRLIADLYRGSSLPQGNSDVEQSDLPMLVVVDDAGLKDMYEEGFEHFLPWMFCVLVEETNGQPEVFEPAEISLPLEELPEASHNEKQGSNNSDGNKHQTLAYTNTPENTDDCEPISIASYYDPTIDG